MGGLLQVSNEIWKKNRNAYAKLLLEQLKAGRIEEPFHRVPPASPLPILPKSLTYTYAKPKRSSEKKKKENAPSRQLESYLTSHGAPSPFPPGGHLDISDSSVSETTPSFRTSPDNQQYTMESAAMRNQSIFQLDNDENRDFVEPTSRQQELELRVQLAEDMLLELSNLLVEMQKQQKIERETKENCSRGSSPRFHGGSTGGANSAVYDHFSAEELIQRAERGSLLPFPHPDRCSKGVLHGEVEMKNRHLGKSVGGGDDAISNILGEFEQRTAVLRGALAETGNLIEASERQKNRVLFNLNSQSPPLPSLSPLAPIPVAHALPPSFQKGASPHNTMSFPPQRKISLRSPLGLKVRHTLKSAAAAAVGASRRGGGGDGAEVESPGMGMGGRPPTQSNNKGAPGSASPVLVLRPGSTAALIREVSVLRKKLTASVASMQARSDIDH